MTTSTIVRKLMLGLGLAILVFIGLVLYGDAREIAHLLRNFRWSVLPGVMLLTLISYLIRGVRFHFYLGQVGVTNVPLWTGIKVFVGGFALTLTPGKLGEFVRLLWLKNLAGADPAKVAPTIIVDRINDGLAMALLATLGGLAYPQYWSWVATIAGILIAAIIVIQIRPLALWCLRLGERLPLVSRIAHHLHTLYESTTQLLAFRNFMVGLGVGLLVLITQGLGLYLVLLGLGVTPNPTLMLFSIFTISIGALLGGASSSPGGLGASEVSMAVILQAAVGLSADVAATATLLIRFFTLWQGVLLGVSIVIIWYRTLFGTDLKSALQPEEAIEVL